VHTLLEILKKSETLLRERGVAEPRLDAEHLIAEVLACQRMDLYLQFDRPLSEEILGQLRPLLARRARREPLSYILGHHPFDSLSLTVRPGALIPRPETEELAQITADHLPKPPKRILDLGTGTGAIALWMKKNFPQAEVIGTDRSEKALDLARENGRKLGLDVRWIASDWFSEIDGTFDLIISNPPYLSENEWQAAEPEVREHEPKEALVAEQSGTSDLFTIWENSPPFTVEGSLIATETGIDQQAALEEKMATLPYSHHWFQSDFHQRTRYLFATR
jgi:release factor glutamine methyltransferase